MVADGHPSGRHKRGLSRRALLKGAAATGASMPGIMSLPELVSAAPNAVSTENAKTGAPPEEWDSYRSPEIEGFATEFSVVPGATVGFKVKTDSVDYRVRTYRLGWYGGR